jgi:glycosyltransferase involved in cell wall biosynthesis
MKNNTPPAVRPNGFATRRVSAPGRDALNIAHLGTYPPRKCGIATYTQDVVSAVHSADAVATGRFPAGPPTVVAMTNASEHTEYFWPVLHTIDQADPEDYRRVARELNNSGTDLVSIQYEHGIFGGEGGRHLNYFLDALRVPVVVTLHTTLPQPPEALARAVREVAARAERLVVLNSRALPLLRDAYGLPAGYLADQTDVIPHGTPDVDPARRPVVRQQLGVAGQTVLSTFGLIGPGKGLEHAVRAVAKVADQYPDLHYYVLGQTHPGIVRESGESYREGLIRMAEDLGIGERVHFVNRYLNLDELCDWLLATDVYVTPYLNPFQIVSGTLAYAVAAGKPVISTPYLHAEELLSEGRGVLTPFSDPDAMARNLDGILADGERRAAMERAAWEFGRRSTWSSVAEQYVGSFARALKVSSPVYRPKADRTRIPAKGTLSHADLA